MFIKIILMLIRGAHFLPHEMPAESLLRAISHSVFKRLIHGYCFQIFLWITIQNQIGVLQRSVVDQPIKLRSLIHIVCHFILHGGAVDGEQRPLRQVQLHTGGVQVELTGQNLSHTRYLPMFKFRLVFRSGTRAVSVVLVTRKQCVWIATHKSGKQCEC